MRSMSLADDGGVPANLRKGLEERGRCKMGSSEVQGTNEGMAIVVYVLVRWYGFGGGLRL